MTRAEIIEQLKNEYRQYRAQAEREQDERAAEIERADPQIRVLWEKQAQLLTDAVRAMAYNAGNAQELAVRMRVEGAQLLKEIEERTIKAGFPADYGKLKYRCEKCKDKGITEDGFCECFQRALNERMGDAKGLDSFETFREDFIPDEAIPGTPYTQRQNNCMARDYLKQFADSFPNNQKKTVVLYGATGVGKTFLLNCVVQRVMERGGDVFRVTAYRMFEAMREKHAGGNEDTFRRMMECGLLAIDDLGSEPMMRNITVEYLFMLLNERTNAGLSTIIATNMTPSEVKERYGERIASRMFDRDKGSYLRFLGKDLRTKNG